MPATPPMRMAGKGLTKPAPGVIATSPATAPLALPPDPVRQRVIDKRRPQESEQQKCLKLHALGEGPGNQGWRNGCKHALENRIGQMGNGVSIRTRLTPHGR